MDGSGKTPIKYTEGVRENLKAGEATSRVEGSDKYWGSCLRSVRGWIPPEYRHELVQLFKLAGPVVSLSLHEPPGVRCVCYPCAVCTSRVQSWPRAKAQWIGNETVAGIQSSLLTQMLFDRVRPYLFYLFYFFCALCMH